MTMLVACTKGTLPGQLVSLRHRYLVKSTALAKPTTTELSSMPGAANGGSGSVSLVVELT